MDKEYYKFALKTTQNYFLRRPAGVERDKLKDIKRLMSQKLDKAIIITGPRRAGKSTLLKQIVNIIKEPFIYISFEDDFFINIKSNQFMLLEQAALELIPNLKVFLLDEIQYAPEWDRFVNRLLKSGYKVFITGSTSLLITEQISTVLTGRYRPILLLPFSFYEYVKFKIPKFNYNEIYDIKYRARIMKLFGEYLFFGSFPEVLKTKDLDLPREYLNDIIYRDVQQTNKVNDIQLCKELALFLLKNTGKEFTFGSIKKALEFRSTHTVINNISALESVYLINYINVFTHSTKTIKTAKKIYAIDVSYPNIYNAPDDKDKGHLLETIVFNELLRRGKKIFFSKHKYECDFLDVDISNKKIKQAIQVSYSIFDSKTKKREINGLLEAMKFFKLKEGLLLTYDQEDEIEVEDKKDKRESKNKSEKDKKNKKREMRKIIVKPVWKWLLEKI